MITAGFLAAVAVGAVTAMFATGGPSGSPAGERAPASRPTSPTNSPAAATTTSAPPEAEPCDDVIASLPLRRRLAQLVMVGVDPGQVEPALELVGQEGVGGIFVGGTDTTLLTGNRLARVHAAAALPLTVAVDEEGGRVQRIDALDGDLPSPRDMARDLTAGQVRDLARQRGSALRARGVTMDFAPVVDVTRQPDGAVIGDRSFGDDPSTVVRYAGAFADGLRDGGVVPVVKHFPGHGRASGDSHESTVVTPPLADLEAVDLVPYQQLLDDDERTAVLVGHVDVPGLTAGQPATLSPATYRLLHEKLRFDGLAITDDLAAMKAVTSRYALPEAVVTALAAGADIALWSSSADLDEVLDGLERAVASGRLTAARLDEALTRVLRLKGLCG